MAFLSKLRLTSIQRRNFSSILNPNSNTPLSSKDKSRAALSLLKSEKNPERILDICRAASLTPDSHLDRIAFSVAISKLSDSNYFEGIRSFLEELKSRPDLRTEKFISHSIVLYGQAGMLDNARQTFEKMHDLGIDRTAKSLNALLFSCIVAKNYGEVDRSGSITSLREKKKARRGDDREVLGTFFKNISTHSGTINQRKLAKEILKLDNAKVSAEIFTFRQLATATNNFNPELLLGEGGFGRVYKGKIRNTNQAVAVKQLDRNGVQGNREFLAEVLMLSLVNHRNLVNLIGYCADGHQRILVYEYMSNGSLEDHLLDLTPDKKSLNWITRMKIAIGAAQGLEYLHDTAKPPIIYRDFKASNILLDEEFNPKLSDFGLAKLGPTGDKQHVSTRVMGTYGYCAPEYVRTGQLTKKSDVYSFGVVFLEIITGRRTIDNARPIGEQNLVAWAEPLFKDINKFTLMADPKLEGKYPMKGLYQAIAIASMCLQEEAKTRPLISDVVTALEYLAMSSADEIGTSTET